MKLEELIAQVKDLWGKACAHDGFPKDAKFVEFSPGNPYTADYQKAMGRLLFVRRAMNQINKGVV